MLEYQSLRELYEALKPAFNVKIRILQNKGIDIKETDIWNYLKDTRWKTATNLGIADMVSDIINISDIELEKYLKSLY